MQEHLWFNCLYTSHSCICLLLQSSKAYADPGMGRIIYERSGEFFFIPYAFTDVNDERDIHKGDEVSFYMAKNKRSQHLPVHNDKH